MNQQTLNTTLQHISNMSKANDLSASFALSAREYWSMISQLLFELAPSDNRLVQNPEQLAQDNRLIAHFRHQPQNYNRWWVKMMSSEVETAITGADSKLIKQVRTYRKHMHEIFKEQGIKFSANLPLIEVVKAENCFTNRTITGFLRKEYCLYGPRLEEDSVQIFVKYPGDSSQEKRIIKQISEERLQSAYSMMDYRVVGTIVEEINGILTFKDYKDVLSDRLISNHLALEDRKKLAFGALSQWYDISLDLYLVQCIPKNKPENLRGNNTIERILKKVASENIITGRNSTPWQNFIQKIKGKNPQDLLREKFYHSFFARMHLMAKGPLPEDKATLNKKEKIALEELMQIPGHPQLMDKIYQTLFKEVAELPSWICHADLNPGNVFYDKLGKPLIHDIGFMSGPIQYDAAILMENILLTDGAKKKICYALAEKIYSRIELAASEHDVGLSTIQPQDMQGKSLEEYQEIFWAGYKKVKSFVCARKISYLDDQTKTNISLALPITEPATNRTEGNLEKALRKSRSQVPTGSYDGEGAFAQDCLIGYTFDGSSSPRIDLDKSVAEQLKKDAHEYFNKIGTDTSKWSGNKLIAEYNTVLTQTLDDYKHIRIETENELKEVPTREREILQANANTYFSQLAINTSNWSEEKKIIEYTAIMTAKDDVFHLMEIGEGTSKFIKLIQKYVPHRKSIMNQGGEDEN